MYLFLALAISILALIIVRARRVSQAKHPTERWCVPPDNVEHPDAMARIAIAEAFNSGKMVISSRDKSGNITMITRDENGNEETKLYGGNNE